MNSTRIMVFLCSLTLISSIAVPPVDAADYRISHERTGRNISLDQKMKLSPAYRLSVKSPWFYMDEQDVEFVMTYNGWDRRENERVRFRNIFVKGKDMIRRAEKRIVASFFLFDNMYGSNKPKHDIVKDITDLLIQKKLRNPDIKIAIILDPLHRSYAQRVSPSVKKFRQYGIDVFYSDLLPTKAATKLGIIEGLAHVLRVANNLTAGLLGTLVNGLASLIPLPRHLDGNYVDLAVVAGAALLKANHRKILVTDIDGTNEYEALVTSANPHNASDDSTNTGITVKGDLAQFIYGVLREDIAQSLRREAQVPLELGSEKYAYLSEATRRTYGLPGGRPEAMARYMTEVLPPVDFTALDRGRLSQSVRARFVSEVEVKRSVLRLLSKVRPDDQVRIQMFYLSDPQVVEMIQQVASQPGRDNNPVQLLLDPSKDAFNAIKDGTPNRQVAHHLLNELKGLHLQIRWYATHGEQNHAKIMSITNPKTGKYQITTGSTNWTGKNLNDINMEANLTVEGSEKLNTSFNQIFDQLWYNDHNQLTFTLPYEAYDLLTTRKLVLGYQKYTAMSESEQEQWVRGHKVEIYQRFVEEHADILGSKSLVARENWLNQKFENDSSARIRAISLIAGEEALASSQKDFSQWMQGYMAKWTKGEKWGYVAW